MCRRRPDRRWSWRTIKTPCSEFQDLDDLFARQVKPIHDFFDSGACFEVLKYERNRHACSLEHPCSTQLSGDTFHGRTLGPIENCHDHAPAFQVLPHSRWVAMPSAVFKMPPSKVKGKLTFFKSSSTARISPAAESLPCARRVARRRGDRGQSGLRDAGSAERRVLGVDEPARPLERHQTGVNPWRRRGAVCAPR
jgi:hypothetical protein